VQDTEKGDVRSCSLVNPTHDQTSKACEGLDLAYAGATSQFATQVPVDAPGDYEVVVYAHDPSNGNTGVDRTTFIATED